MEEVRQEVKHKMDAIKQKIREKGGELSREEMQILLFSLLLEEEYHGGH